MYGTVYLRFCRPTQKAYVGQTTNTVESRWRDRYAECPLFGRVLKKYGKAAFDTAILAVAETQEELDRLETEWIAFYKTLHPNGYNLKTGGGQYGKHHPDTLKKLSILATGRKQSPEQIAKRVAYHQGAKRSDESKKRMSEAKTSKGYKPPTSAVEAARIVNKGIVRSPETREKMRQSKLGIPRPQWVKDKISQIIRKQNEEKKLAELLTVRTPAGPPDISVISDASSTL